MRAHKIVTLSRMLGQLDAADEALQLAAAPKDLKLDNGMSSVGAVHAARVLIGAISSAVNRELETLLGEIG